jgi:hypothetical protein
MVSLSLSGQKHPNRSLVGEEWFLEVELPLYGVLRSFAKGPGPTGRLVAYPV